MSNVLSDTEWTFQGPALAYDENIAPILALWTDQLLDSVPLVSGARVLDVACGTGTVARRVAGRLDRLGFGNVAGVDFNEDMLALAHALAQRDGLVIDWRRAEATELPFADASFDLVLCQQGLQFFPDRDGALAEMVRVLKPGGLCGFVIWRSVAYSPGLARVIGVFERYVGTEAIAGARAPFQLGDAHAVRGLLARAGLVKIGMQIVVHETRAASVRDEIATMADFVDDAWHGLTEDDRRLCVEEVQAAVADYVDDTGFVYPMEAHIFTAQRPL